ncbi:NAD(P)-binding protein [Mycena capillaripes]|nr:NAD(P)-binding protein [Mycena capillaripes]
MTITQDPSAPLVAVVGATGIQGGSVIKALEESNKPYRIRGFTRDATKPVSRELVAKGIEIVTVSIGLDNVKDVFKAFTGANMAFLVTNFWEHLDADRETAEGKLMIDAAKAAGVDRIVWSGLPSFTKHSGGKYNTVVHFDSKVAVTEYGRQSGVPFVDVQAGFYASNLLMPAPLGMVKPVKRTDGSFAIGVPVKPSTVYPIIDAARDYGLYVRRALESPIFPDGSEVRTGEYITMDDLALQLSQATGKRIVMEQMDFKSFEKQFTDIDTPPRVVRIMSDGYKALEEFGYYGGKAISSAEGLARPPLPFIEFAKTADWSKVLV